MGSISSGFGGSGHLLILDRVGSNQSRSPDTKVGGLLTAPRLIRAVISVSAEFGIFEFGPNSAPKELRAWRDPEIPKTCKRRGTCYARATCTIPTEGLRIRIAELVSHPSCAERAVVMVAQHFRWMEFYNPSCDDFEIPASVHGINDTPSKARCWQCLAMPRTLCALDADDRARGQDT